MGLLLHHRPKKNSRRVNLKDFQAGQKCSVSLDDDILILRDAEQFLSALLYHFPFVIQKPNNTAFGIFEATFAKWTITRIVIVCGIWSFGEHHGRLPGLEGFRTTRIYAPQ